MAKQSFSIVEWADREQQAVLDLIAFFQQGGDGEARVYETWTAKDVLGHLTSWHMSFARNLKSAVEGTKPTLLKGSLGDINEKEVKAMAAFSIDDLIRRLTEAQKVIESHILDSRVQEIAYRQGSRCYTPVEHLELVERHIRGHLRDLMASSRKTKN